MPVGASHHRPLWQVILPSGIPHGIGRLGTLQASKLLPAKSTEVRSVENGFERLDKPR